MRNNFPIRRGAISQWLALLGGLTACLLTVSLYGPPAQAEGCFPDIYYELLFSPFFLQSSPEGDSRLRGFSDYLAAEGKDPHAKQGEGCMCGVNNGRWDQGLLNASLQDAARPPVSFRIDRLGLEIFTRQDKPQGQSFVLNSPTLAGCLNAGLNKGDHRRFDHPAGLMATPGVLEPGENMLGCLCLKPVDRTKSGYVRLRVDYTSVIAAKALPGSGARQQSEAGKTLLRQSIKIGPLTKGQARYFQLKAPAGAEGAVASIALAQAKGLALFTAEQWQPQQRQWRSGGFEGPLSKQGSLLIMARAVADRSEGELRLRLSWVGAKLQLPGQPSAPRLLPAGPPAARFFKVFVLGMGSSSPKGAAFGSAPQRPCCDGGAH